MIYYNAIVAMNRQNGHFSYKKVLNTYETERLCLKWS